jgi:predicted amidohydrolase
MRVGIVQMTSTDDLAANLDAASDFVREAAAQGAEFVALPEMFAYLRREGLEFPHAQRVDGEILGQMRALARTLGVRLLAGTIAEQAPGERRVFNTSVLLSPEGEIEGVYRKMHLFDVDLGAAGGGVYRESASIAAGDAVVVAETPHGGVGLSVCYDLRFPELYRRMADRDARFLTVPSAFAVTTGRDHWEVLLRARAIENQAFVIAPAQCGRHSESRESYGRSMIIDPWGRVLARLGHRPGVAVADCDPAVLRQTRESVPALHHRRL